MVCDDLEPLLEVIEANNSFFVGGVRGWYRVIVDFLQQVFREFSCEEVDEVGVIIDISGASSKSLEFLEELISSTIVVIGESFQGVRGRSSFVWIGKGVSQAVHGCVECSPGSIGYVACGVDLCFYSFDIVLCPLTWWSFVKECEGEEDFM